MENKNLFLNIYEELKELFQAVIKEKTFPGAAVGISIFDGSQKKSFLCTFGSPEYSDGSKLNKYFFYDLASLTKPLATTLAVLSLIKDKISLDDTLFNIIGIAVPDDKKGITLRHLLSHSSGLPAYRPYFKEKLVQLDIIKKILAEKLVYKTGERQLYSDLGFMLIGYIIEKCSAMRLDKYVKEHIYKPMNLADDIFFNFGNKLKKGINFVPTELCPWRKKLLCGQVHDDNAFMMNGVAGQAGLFGNIYGVTALVDFLVDIINGKKSHPNIRRDDLIKFTKKQENNESFGLGFDTPSKNSSSGHYFSKKSFGHLGFTGTSFWVDLEKKVSIVLLTNRVHPSRENNRIKTFRPLFHDKIMNIITP